MRTCALSISVVPVMADALALRHVSAGYGETVVLEDVSLALAHGESISVIGRNGVGKTTLLANMGNQLSGGEQQMLAIARALLTNPSVLLMDEPTEGLAPVIVEALAAVLSRLRGEGALSIVLVEQNSRVALAFSPRTVVMDKGRIVYDGESAALSTDPERLAGLIGVA